MLENRSRQLVPNIEDQAIIYGRAVQACDVEEVEHDAWNSKIGGFPAGVAIEFSNWSRDAVTAQDYSLSFLRRFMFEDPATELVTLERNENQVIALIGKIRITRSIPDRENIARRLFDLVQDIRDEEPESGVMSLESLRSFYGFLQMYGYLRKPSVGLTPANEIYVSWKGEHHSVFSIHFLASGLARFAIMAPGSRPGQQVRLTATDNIENLMEKVKPWGVLKWAGREQS